MPDAVEMHGVIPSMTPIAKSGKRFWMVARCSVRSQILCHDPPLPGGLTRPAPRRLRQQIRPINCHGGILGRRIRRRALRLMSALDFSMAARQILLTGNGRGNGLSRLAWDSGSVECHAAWSRAIEVARPAPTPGRGPPTVSGPVSMTQGSMACDGLLMEESFGRRICCFTPSRTIFSLVFPVSLCR